MLLLGLLGSSAASGQLLRYAYPAADEPEAVFFDDRMRLIIDPEGHLTIDDLLSDSTLTAVDPRQASLPDPPYYLWSSIELVNPGPDHQLAYLVSLPDIDTLWTYTVAEGRVVEERWTGQYQSPWRKNLPTIRNTTPVNLAPGSTRTVYLRYHIDLPSTRNFLHQLFYLEPLEAANRKAVGNYIWQSFYLGFMLLFALLSGFMYRLFRERVFLFFGGLVLSFGLYFMSAGRITEVYLTDWWPGRQFHLMKPAIAGIVLSLTWFAIDYLRLRDFLPLPARLFGIYALFIEAFSFGGLLIMDYNTNATIHNFLLLPWVLTCFALVSIMAWRKQRPGRIMFRMIIFLFIASALYILGSNDILPDSVLLQNAFQIGTMVFAVVLFNDLFTRIDTIRREKERYQELDHLKSRFFANISHEFRTPLTLILGPIKQLRERLTTGEDRRLMEIMQRHAEKLLQLINEILDLSKLEAGKMSLQAREVNFTALLKGIVMSFESLAQQEGVRLHFAAQEEDLTLWVDPAKIEQIFNNLLSNAFKHTTVSDEVAVLLMADEQWAKVQVRDTGRGIAEEQLPHIFNRFFQMDLQDENATKGTGIGLALVKELVQLHGGTIEVRSKEQHSTTFTLSFPRRKDHRQAGELQTEGESWVPEAPPPVRHFSEEEGVAPASGIAGRHLSEQPLVLIIEDHPDVRYYIRQNLRADYQIVEAANGREGIEKAWDFLPDLIISDVMMPDRNGYEVCRILKADQRSSHIPLILLTARAAREEKLQGLEEGADDYLVKPFDTEELQLRVRNLIESRRRLREQYDPATEGGTIDPQLSGPDRAFLQTIYSTLDEQLDNEQLSVEVLAEAVSMSRRHLNRKLTALTGLSANPFIRNYRLQKAMRMLRERSGNVSEVALATGFSSTAYFVKCFREHFGQTPGSI